VCENAKRLYAWRPGFLSFFSFLVGYVTRFGVGLVYVQATYQFMHATWENLHRVKRMIFQDVCRSWPLHFNSDEDDVPCPTDKTAFPGIPCAKCAATVKAVVPCEVCACVRVCVCMCMCVYVCMYICVYIYGCVYVYVLMVSICMCVYAYDVLRVIVG